MTTRLTKDMRAEIIDSVLAATDLDEQRKVIEKDTAALAEELVRNNQPQGWFALIAGHPKEWFQLQTDLYNGSSNPLKIINRDSYRYIDRIGLSDSVPVAKHFGLGTKELEIIFAPLCERATKWRETYDETKGELSAFLNSCQTVEKVVERMPELAKHVTTKQKTFPLVAPSNVLSRLAKLGFDRTATA